jgi:hypothetical protein
LALARLVRPATTAIAVSLAVLLASCGSGEADRDAQGGALTEQGPAPVRGPLSLAFVLPENGMVPADQLAAALRSAGYPCEAVTGMGQLEKDGKALDIYKIDCGKRSYEVMLRSAPPANTEQQDKDVEIGTSTAASSSA